MICSNCKGRTRVTHSEIVGRTVRRWRVCRECKRRVVTYEVREVELTGNKITSLRGAQQPQER